MPLDNHFIRRSREDAKHMKIAGGRVLGYKSFHLQGLQITKTTASVGKVDPDELVTLEKVT